MDEGRIKGKDQTIKRHVGVTHPVIIHGVILDEGEDLLLCGDIPISSGL